MGEIGLGLSYVLPRTEFKVDVVSRSEVQRDDDGKHWLCPVVDVSIASTAVADLEHKHILRVDAGLLEKISLVITLDDRGFITALNTEAGRDISPVITLAGKVVSVAASIAASTLAIDEPDHKLTMRARPLEDIWAEKNEDVEAVRADLTERVKALLQQMANRDTATADLVGLGAALAAVQTQLASLSETRRAWIAGQGSEKPKRTFNLRPEELLRVEMWKDTIREPLPPVSKALQTLIKKHGALVTIVDPNRAANRANKANMQTDQVALRRSRPVEIGVYTRSTDATWTLDPASRRSLDIVDEFSQTDPLSIDGSWWRLKKFELSYHADMSLKTFGVSSTSNVSAVATSAGTLLDSVVQARKDLSQLPSDADKALKRAKTQLEILQAESAYEVLSATKNRAPELAALEQEKKLHDASN